MWALRIAAIAIVVAGCSFDPGGAGIAGDDSSDRDRPDAAAAEDGGAVGNGGDSDSGASGVSLRFNLGGPEHSGTDFPGTWAADPGTVCDGDGYNLTDVDVVGTVDDPLFLFWQYSFTAINCSLGQNLPPGNYELTLVFGEIWIGPGCPYSDERVFDIYVEGQLMESGLDTVAVGGCCHENATNPGSPFTRVFTATIDDGSLDVLLDAQPDAQTMVSAIQLRQL